MKRIMFIGRDESVWEFEKLTGLSHPKTNDESILQIYAQAALDQDNRLARFQIIEVK